MKKVHRLSPKSKARLQTVEPRLAKLIEDCIKTFPLLMAITEGKRTLEQQKGNVRIGVSQTLNSYHIPKDGEDFSRAVDVAIFKADGWYSTDIEDYRAFADTVLEEAKNRGLKVTWGGNWKTLVDGPHFQIEN